MTQEYGLGALPDPHDPRDYPVEALYAAEGLTPTPAAALPASYAAPGMPPVLNQGATPQCVAFSTSSMKAWQDRRDTGQFWDFDEPKFFAAIGGGPYGAYVGSAMQQLLTTGYPVVSIGQASRHRIAAYYVVPRTAEAIKAAILDLGPVVLSTPWHQSWFSPVAGVLPPPGPVISNHAIVAYGWDDRGIRLRNSWGAAWSIGGDCWMPEAYLPDVDAVWKTADVIDHAYRASVRVGAWWAYTRLAGAWTRQRRWTGGFSADCTRPVAMLVMGSSRPMSRLKSGAYAGLWVDTAASGITIREIG
jgi:hypothetical protein